MASVYAALLRRVVRCWYFAFVARIEVRGMRVGGCDLAEVVQSFFKSVRD